MSAGNGAWAFPEGKKKALTLSYDDGVLQDARLAELFRRYHLKGTFNINSGLLGQKGMHRSVDHSCWEPEQLKEIYAGFEIAMHTCTHIRMAEVSDAVLTAEVEEDRRRLEALTGFRVRGLAYPSGSYDRHVMEKLADMQVLYARTIWETERFDFPKNLLEWSGTCRHTNPKWLKLTEEFLEPEAEGLFFVWGHSYEFDIYDNWEKMERFCTMVADRDDIWYATNAEVAEWLLDQRRRGTL